MDILFHAIQIATISVLIAAQYKSKKRIEQLEFSIEITNDKVNDLNSDVMYCIREIK